MSGRGESGRDRDASTPRPPPRPAPRPATRTTPSLPDAPEASLLAQLRRLERHGGDGVLAFPDGRTLPVTHLGRLVDPAHALTKGDLLRHYLRVARVAVPALVGRPLVLTRRPAGLAGPAFHQHDPGEHPPDAATVAHVPTADGGSARRLIGSLGSLLHAVQLGAFGVDAWHARVGDLEHPDYAVLDLDPPADTPAGALARVARAVRAALRARGRDGVPKSSGSRGLHVLVPLRPGTSWLASAALAEEVAEAVVAAEPTLATVVRPIAERPRGAVYVDHLQNARGKTLAAVLAARARPGLGVSTPLGWRQIAPALNLHQYTVGTVPRQLAAIERRWQAAWRAAAPPDAWRPT